MPELNGWEVAEAIKAKWPFIPVVLLTGWGDQAVQAETRRHVFVSKILYKPASRKVLQEVITALTGPAHV
jgi:FixJ family two-component response regulator